MVCAHLGAVVVKTNLSCIERPAQRNANLDVQALADPYYPKLYIKAIHEGDVADRPWLAGDVAVW